MHTSKRDKSPFLSRIETWAGRTFVFLTSICSVCWIEVLIYCWLHHGIEGYYADALLDFIWRAFVLVQCGNFDIFLLETNTCCCARRLRSKRVVFEILNCLRRADKISSSSCQREWTSMNRGVLNLSNFFLNLSKLWGVLNLSKFCLIFFLTCLNFV